MSKLLIYIVGTLVVAGIFVALFVPRSFDINPGELIDSNNEKDTPDTSLLSPFEALTGQAEPTSTEAEEEFYYRPRAEDIGFQEQLPNPPKIVKGIYVTGWVAGSASRMSKIIELVERTEINAVIIDIKDFSGHVSYYMNVPLVREVRADKEIRILRPNALIKTLHDRGIYVVARQTIMQDPILAKARPEWALQDKTNGGIWKDNKGLGWMDPASKEVWDYNIAIARDAFARGFDEVNFDYIRFASDGNLSNIGFPVWGENESKDKAIRRFFAYLRNALEGELISADLFGLTTVNRDHLGIGQVIEDAYEYFDYVCPMVYPSHYASGFIGLQNPGAHPYEVMKYSLDRARERWDELAISLAGSTSTEAVTNSQARLGKLRPWIQDFDLGAVYTAEMVRSEIQSVYDAVRDVGPPSGESRSSGSGGGGAYAGWYIWDPANTYTEGALEPQN